MESINTEEQRYLNLLEELVTHGANKSDRTGTGTKYLFGRSLRFSLRDNKLPLLTTKKMFWRGIVEELLFFLSGNTDTKALEAKGVNIWKGNTSREFLDKQGLYTLPEGDLGCSYSHQWRNFGGEHPNIPETHGSKGFDQVANIVTTLKTNPLDRRMIINGWCANQLDYMALPPCHVLYVFSVNPETKELNCHMTQRSVDSFLGAPFNIASTALLTILFAKTANLSPGEIFWTGTDCHVYNNHIDAVKLQIARTPFEFPTLKIAKPLEALEDILTLKFEDLALSNYRHHPAIKAEMAV